jgi:hypothetical protein
MEYDNGHWGRAFALSVPLGLMVGYLAGFREYWLLLVSFVAIPIIYYSLIFITGLIVPPQAVLLENKTEKNSD